MLSSLIFSGSPMASNSDPAQSPNSQRPVRSFRVERTTSPEPTTRIKRASTFENGAQPARLSLRTASGTQVTQGGGDEAPDTFVSRISEEAIEPPRASVDFDDLPIELISLTDRFIDSLSAKVHPTPPNIDNLAYMFQEFYGTASSHIQTHIDALASRQRREDAPPLSTRASAASLLRAKATSLGTKDKTPLRRDSDQQLLTPEEYANRKKARRALEQKKSLLEEAVERRLCEGIYSKIYRHRSTQDEAQDAKLRSKTAALSVVGIGPVDLGVELGTADNDLEAAAKKQEEVREWLEQARNHLALMSQSRYPLGKLNHLKSAHKSIIDTLSHFHPSSSADELMPMLIYTLITLTPENLSVISDVNFIQRFRWEPKLTGEAAYCLTTLEAAVSFLETVDLSTLRADETPTGPLKNPGSSPLPKGDTFPPAFSPTSPAPPAQSPNPSSESASASLSAALKQQSQAPSPSQSPAGFRATVNAQLRARRLSDLVRNTPTPAQALNAASDAVLTTADQSLKTIGSSLDNSYKFLLGKLRERAPDAVLTKADGGEVIVPKTLDDARKLIGTPPLPNPDDDLAPTPELSLRSPSPEQEPERPPLLSFISGTGRKVSRDHSADSSRSAGSSSRRGLGVEDPHHQQQRRAEPGAPSSTTQVTATGSSPVVTSPPIIDSMRNLSNSFNPMARLSAGIGGLRGFGRSSAASTAGPAGAGRAPTPPAKDAGGGRAGAGAVVGAGEEEIWPTYAFPDLAAVLPPREPPKITPPHKRFMELQNAADLKLGEVFDLLKDYKRLAGALKEMGAFKE
ncbi:hypothetical protein CHGG_05685 [Chaetomium globosum CBS 148.51]|uniref:VPS9 domain-containing protein n=1 Tax=Chaetomium globosum (strain ATCC 6205 / CBS 148.51 / DSM 1962 / NBRC 6347 / NRRL 1970) TaxID=306901 RepID=Q2H6N0_CHAGB|nr:uncharacterized protein CHGG_05685 [Chaetomium globosum CBS 148.51]EAQ89066.1 hypothetical protein CHGG_05685 [Chaetomium globosum CBS 148.51]